MSDFETFAERPARQILAADHLTEEYIRNRNIEGEHDAEKVFGGAILDIVAEEVGDDVIEQPNLRYKVFDMGENYPGVSIKGYKKRVTLAKFNHRYKKAEPAFRVYELSRIDKANSMLGIVIVDEVDQGEPNIGLWVYCGRSVGFHEVTEEDVQAGRFASEIHDMVNAISAPELDIRQAA